MGIGNWYSTTFQQREQLLDWSRRTTPVVRKLMSIIKDRKWYSLRCSSYSSSQQSDMNESGLKGGRAENGWGHGRVVAPQISKSIRHPELNCVAKLWPDSRTTIGRRIRAVAMGLRSLLYIVPIVIVVSILGERVECPSTDDRTIFLCWGL